jgi:hypothetical protein
MNAGKRDERRDERPVVLSLPSGLPAVAGAALLIMAACAPSESPRETPTGPPLPVPSLAGTVWEGEWGGNVTHPMSLAIESQTGEDIGAKVSFIQRGSTFIHPARGTVRGRPQGRAEIRLQLGGAGTSSFTLATADAEAGVGSEMQGRGLSPHHDGPVRLKRTR